MSTHCMAITHLCETHVDCHAMQGLDVPSRQSCSKIGSDADWSLSLSIVLVSDRSRLCSKDKAHLHMNPLLHLCLDKKLCNGMVSLLS